MSVVDGAVNTAHRGVSSAEGGDSVNDGIIGGLWRGVRNLEKPADCEDREDQREISKNVKYIHGKKTAEISAISFPKSGEVGGKICFLFADALSLTLCVKQTKTLFLLFFLSVFKLFLEFFIHKLVFVAISQGRSPFL